MTTLFGGVIPPVPISCVPALNADGQPSSPCHPARARQLLQHHKARIVSRLPFVIQIHLNRFVEHPEFAPVTRPSRYHLFERFGVVKTAQGLLGISKALMGNATVRIAFFHKPDDRKTSFSFYRPESLTIVQKGSSQTWISVTRTV